jgi:hypothetical protein
VFPWLFRFLRSLVVFLGGLGVLGGSIVVLVSLGVLGGSIVVLVSPGVLAVRKDRES